MKTIQAKVNPRLLTKANRLFTGTLEGRIIEILQNARRAGATKVEITNQDGRVIVRDNGRGVEDFSKLLDLGGSGWEESLETSEDPAGVGLFCLAAREVTIRSNGRIVTIGGQGWTGKTVEIHDDPDPQPGAILSFPDEPWASAYVDRQAVFSGLHVTVDGIACPREPFVTKNAVPHPELGCRIEVCESGALSSWHTACRRSMHCSDNVFVNFHGQVIALDYRPVDEQHLCFLVDLTGEPTGIRLMLPARTCLVENQAFVQLNAVLEREAYHYVQRRGSHRLPYKNYLRARELGVPLPEARPVYSPGLLCTDMAPEPVEATVPEDFPLERCYRFASDYEGEDTDWTNAHLLAALGRFEQPFIPVNIRQEYDGYSWARLPTIEKVEVTRGNELCSQSLWSGKLTCVDSLTITAQTNDGKVFSSPVCMAKSFQQPADGSIWIEDEVFVKPAAQDQLYASHIWYHLGGWSEDGDTYETQEHDFEQARERFWTLLVGPDEQLRRTLVNASNAIKKNWKAVRIQTDGTVMITLGKGKTTIIRPPAAQSV